MQSRIYTIKDIAEILKVHRTYVASLIADKKLAALKIGRFYRIRQEQLEKLIGGKLDGAILTIEDIAEILKVHRTYVASLIADKKLAALKIGRFYRIRQEQLEKLIGGKLDGAILTIEDIAEILKVHRTYVAGLIADKKLAALKIGRFYRIRQEQLEKLIGGKLDGAILTIEDIAEILKVHRTYVARLVREKKIKSVQIGKFYRIREKDFEAFIEESEV